MGEKDQREELLETLGDFTSKENWDKFFTIRGSDDSFEWYAEWPELRDPLLSYLPSVEVASSQILVPGCGNSRLSEHLYEAGFKAITNVDFSKVVISDMLRRNVRVRPDMRWRVMDMTSMQFADETFGIVLDKGGLDALMEPEHGTMLGNQYLSEVKRVLKSAGKFICLTLAESHVLGLLFPKFRYGWNMTIDAIPQKPSNKPNLQTFMVVAEKDKSAILNQISSTINVPSQNHYGIQARGLYEALENENKIRMEYSNSSDIFYSFKDLQLGVKGNLAECSPGQRIKLSLGEGGTSRFCYKAVLLDAQDRSGPFVYHCGIFIVPKVRAHEWLFSSSEGQWMVVESSKAARLIMVFLDASHTNASMDDIQKDLSPLVKQLAPGTVHSGAQIPFMAASDGIKQRKIIHQVTSPLTGPIVIEDVVYEKLDDNLSHFLPSKDLIFRRLIFQRMENLVQSEGLLTKEGPLKVLGKADQKKAHTSSKSKKRGNQTRNDSPVMAIDELSKYQKIDHNYLASAYHTVITSGLMLISSFLESASSNGRMVKALVIGLGAGLLPMYLHAVLPCLYIEVAELDPVVLDLAKDYFGLREDKRLKVHIIDGIQCVRYVANSEALSGEAADHEDKDVPCNAECSCSNQSHIVHDEGKRTSKCDILIVDVDSADSSSGMTCPAADFVEESFLLIAKSSLSEQGLFVINLVSRSRAIKELVESRMKMVFGNLFCVQLEEDVNVVLFAINSDAPIKEDSFPEASCCLQKLLNLKYPESGQSIIDTAKKIKRLE